MTMQSPHRPVARSIAKNLDPSYKYALNIAQFGKIGVNAV